MMTDSYQKHQRYILRRFPPFLDDSMIGNHEKFRLMLIILWSGFVALPTVLAAWTCDYFVKEPLFYFSILMIVFVVARALHRYCVRWPEGHLKRWSYWHEIELATAPYKLKIMGYYHRKIDHFLGQFPIGTTDVQIHRYYNIRSCVIAVIFFIAYAASTTFLCTTDGNEYSQILILYILSVASVCVLFYLGKVYWIELPQVMVLRHRPEFASDVLFSEMHDESIPFAQPVPNYKTSN